MTFGDMMIVVTDNGELKTVSYNEFAEYEPAGAQWLETKINEILDARYVKEVGDDQGAVK